MCTPGNGTTDKSAHEMGRRGDANGRHCDFQPVDVRVDDPHSPHENTCVKVCRWGTSHRHARVVGLTVIIYTRYRSRREEPFAVGYTRRHTSKKRNLLGREMDQSSEMSSYYFLNKVTRTAEQPFPNTRSIVISSPARHTCNPLLCPCFCVLERETSMLHAPRHTTTHTRTHLFQCPHVAVNSFRAWQPSHVPQAALFQLSQASPQLAIPIRSKK